MTTAPDTVLPDTTEKPRLLSVTALAALKGVSKQTISEKVKRLVADGRLTPVAGKGREKLIDLAEYELAIGAVADPAKQLALEIKGATERLEPQAHGGALLRREAVETAADVDPSYRDASTREKLAKAQLAEIELQERLGRLIPVSEVEDAMVRVARVMVGVIDRQQLKAPELTAAAVKEGDVGSRRVIKAMGFELRTALAEALTLQAKGDAPEQAAPGPLPSARPAETPSDREAVAA